MRIVSGKYKGRRINAPRTIPARPTTDFAKEALFNILNNQFFFSDMQVMDLFAGIGSICLEFASRGTENVTAVDSHPEACKFIKDTAEKLEASIQVIQSDVFDFLNKTSSQYDLIFADPPYDFTAEDLAQITEAVTKNSLLKEEGVLIIEHSKHTSIDHLPNFYQKRKYGSSVFSFFKLNE
ncbi:MAG: 16S rRNA (guanine(966)-N(2))-methyltransferase RsmD [Flavobacteriaceae bacterium]|nr:16S rRNA (guanine(966)-N(2))-methyltransferase RsmD [Flavobacteriaceae bacterium]